MYLLNVYLHFGKTLNEFEHCRAETHIQIVTNDGLRDSMGLQFGLNIPCIDLEGFSERNGSKFTEFQK